MNASTCSRLIASTLVGIPRPGEKTTEGAASIAYVSTVRPDLCSARNDLRKLAVTSSTLMLVVSEAALMARRIVCSASGVRNAVKPFPQVIMGT
jgi:hypothetical protein